MRPDTPRLASGLVSTDNLLRGVSLIIPAPSSAKLCTAEFGCLSFVILVAACEGAITVVEMSEFEPIVKLV